MHKAIGLITCASVMAVSLYLFSGGDPSRTLSAQTDSENGEGYGAVARRFLQDAREQAQKGNLAEARRLAGTAASLCSDWSASEQSPDQFLKSLNESGQATGGDDTLFAQSEPAADNRSDSTEVNPFEEAVASEEATGEQEPAAPVTSGELLKKKQAQRLVKEARNAMSGGDVALARTRALQARQLNASWGLWDDRPEHVLADLDKKTKTSTFVAGGRPTPSTLEIRSKDAEDEYQQATALLSQARAAMDAGKLSEAQQLVDKAATFNVSYGIFEDSPAIVSRDLRQLAGSGSAAYESFASASADSSPDAEQARQLLRDAREALTHGRLTEAREKANKASRLNVSYNVLDDRPELVLNDIEAATRGQSGIHSRHDNASGNANNDSAASTDAHQLVANARKALENGDPDAAQQFAVQAQQQDAAFGLLEDRPELVLEEAQLMAQRENGQGDSQGLAQKSPVDVTPARSQAADNPFAATAFDNSEHVNSDFPVIAPEELSADAAYRHGVELFRSGDRAGAKLAFAQAWRKAGELSAVQRRQLQDFLQDLATVRNSQVQLASGQQEFSGFADGSESSASPVEEKDPLTAAAEASDVQFDRLRTEVMNSVFRAEKLKNDSPDEALQILDNTLATVESAPLNKESLETLAGYIRRSQDTIRTHKEQMAPNLARDERNRNVLEDIKRETETKIRIEQEFAELVDQYNELLKEKRFAEAELVAKKAKDLNADSSAAALMVDKAKMYRQNYFNQDIRDRKADSFTRQLNDVDLSSILPAGEYNLPDAKSWKDLTDRRRRYDRPDNRDRTDSELQIEKSLGEKVSLHFHDVPLTEVIRHIATVHGINIAMKTRSIETEGLTATQPVSIDVDGITLKSALSLLLDQAGGLVYSIENETLMISNRLEQETTYELATYPVADLVVPLSMSVSNTSSGLPQLGSDRSLPGTGLYQVDDQLAVGLSGSQGRQSNDPRSSSGNGVDFSGLIDLITTSVEPGTWDMDGGNGTIATEENTLSLVIRQTGAVHEQIGELLSQLRKLQDLQVTVEVRFISVSDNFFERIGVDFDFNVQDNLGDPPGVPTFGSRQLTFPGGAAAGGGGGGGQQAADLRGGQGQGGQGGQGGQQAQAGAARGLFDTINRVNSPRDDFKGQVAGLANPGQFTQDYDIQFRQGSFQLGVPDFGGYTPDAGIQVGMAILSDIEAFFFIQAAQGDRRANIMFAPKVTLYNGQLATIQDQTTRYLVTGQTPVVGTGSVGFSTQITGIPDGIQLTVVAVISADRRYVRLSLGPQFQQLIEVQTFTQVNLGGGAGLGGGGGGQGGGGFGGGQGGQQGQQGQGGGSSQGTVQLPVISTISVSTTVSVPDGGTVLLGGIKRLRESRRMNGVPILNKIPYVSRLFKNSGVGRETESIMLMVTPRIIIQEEEEENVTGTATE